MHRFGIKQKILLVLCGALVLSTALDVVLTSYFTDRQNREAAMAVLNRDLLAWENDLQASTGRLHEVALAAVGDPLLLDQFAELISLDLKCDDVSSKADFADSARILAYGKTISLNRLLLVLRSGGFSSIAVYLRGSLSHYVSEEQAGMMVRRDRQQRAWLASSPDSRGNFPLQSWPAWAETALPAAASIAKIQLTAPKVEFVFPSPEVTAIEITVPVQGAIRQFFTDTDRQPVSRLASELAVADAAHDGPQPPPLAVVVFRKLIDRGVLEDIERRTGKWPALFSSDGRHRQQLMDFELSTRQLQELSAHAKDDPAGGLMDTPATIKSGSYYVSLHPLGRQTPLVLGLASSRETTLENVRQTAGAILSAAGVVLLLSLALGFFWIERFIDPIVALTAAVRDITARRQRDGEEAAAPGVSLQPVAITAPDEVGELARSFNAMLAELQHSFETLEQRVQDRTADLRQQTRYLRTLIDTLPMWAALKDTQSRILAANQAIAKTAGCSVEELVGKTDIDIWPPATGDQMRDDEAKVIATGQRQRIERRSEVLDAWIEIERAPVFDEDGTVLGLVVVARDITEQKTAAAAREAALAEAERLARVRSEFLAQMSHELRTPLNGILGYAQILRQEQNLTERQRAGLEIIQQSGEHLLTLINDVLDLAKIEAGKMALQQVDIPLAAFLRVISEMISIRAQQKGLRFVAELAPELPTGIRVDDKRLRQVLLNLLSNAVKFTDQGHVVLRVSAATAGRLRFEVEDRGVGIAADQLENIFQPFEQAGELRHRAGGTGLGLAISRQYVRLMGGDIHVESTLGRGSRFWFEIEVAVVVANAAPVLSNVVKTGYLGPRKTILVVDDIAQNRAVLIDTLRPLGFEVSEAADGRAGLEKARMLHPDLILMDMVMPEMDGIEATQRLHATPGFSDVPVVGVSASASGSDAERCLAAGMSTFLAKPVQLPMLLAEIGRLLRLQWIEAGMTHDDDEDIVVAPPADQLDALYRLALLGNMRDITQWAEQLAQLDERYAPFARQLRAMAKGYQSKAILSLVERYRRGETNDQNADADERGPDRPDRR